MKTRENVGAVAMIVLHGDDNEVVAGEHLDEELRRKRTVIIFFLLFFNIFCLIIFILVIKCFWFCYYGLINLPLTKQ